MVDKGRVQGFGETHQRQGPTGFWGDTRGGRAQGFGETPKGQGLGSGGAPRGGKALGHNADPLQGGFWGPL